MVISQGSFINFISMLNIALQGRLGRTVAGSQIRVSETP